LGALLIIASMIDYPCPLPAQATGGPVEGQRVTVLAYGCPFTAAKTITVSMDSPSAALRDRRNVRVPVNVTPNGALQFAFQAPFGPIYISYSMDGQTCMTGGGGLVILPGRNRHILVAMQPMSFVADWHDRKFVAGTMPTVPVSVSVVVSKTAACPDEKSPETAAAIDDGAYYVGYMYGPHMFLKLRSADHETLYLALPDAVPVDSNSQYVRRDVTEDDLRTLTTHGLNQEVRCIQSPSGTSMRFP